MIATGAAPARGPAAPPPAPALAAAAPRARPAPGAAMAVRALRLSEFRNYRALRHEFARGPVVLSGPNGAGKTNLLEAVSLLAPGRGLRGARLADLRRRAAPPGAEWAVAARVDSPLGAADIGTGGEPGAAAAPRRAVRIDGRPARGQAALAERLAVVWLTPAMDRLFADSPGRRRDFLDRLASGLEPRHAGALAAYEKAARARQRLLADGAEAAWLDAAEETMAARGVAVAATRAQAVERLSAALRLADGPFPRAGLALVGALDDWLAAMPAVDVEQRFATALRESRDRDRESGGAAVGAHRADLAVVDIDRGAPAAQCSTGEQKALLVAIVLAAARLHAARRGAAPLLLLDEVAAHLDSRRRGALVEAAAALGGQVWLTGAEAGLFDALAGRAQFLAVGDGRLRPAAVARWA